MIDTVYAQASFIALVVCGILVALKRSLPHATIWAALGFYWCVTGFVQVRTGVNSIPYVAIPLLGIIAYTSVSTAGKTLTIWPLIVAGLACLSILINVTYAIYELPDDSTPYRVRRLHQDAGAVIFYLCLLCVSVHPKAKARGEQREKHSYC